MSHDSTPVYTDADFIKDDLRRCDLVMKGGITSGVVYPPAIIELATRYRFVNVGGTSAGAIAAAAAAAAEYGRDVPYAGYRSSFLRLDRLRVWLGEHEDHIPGLFQPPPRMKPLFNVLLDLTIASRTQSQTPPGRPSTHMPGACALRIPAIGMRFVWRTLTLFLRSARVLIRHHWQVTLGVSVIIALIVLAIQILISISNDGFVSPIHVVRWVAPAVLIGAIVGILAGAGHLVWLAVYELPRNLFGLCSGHTAGAMPQGWPPTLGDDQGRGRPPALTDWLHAVINGLAGRDARQPPLTFGDLERKGIALRTMTSNLSEHMPYVLPKDLERFLFDPNEWARLFPDVVVEHLCIHSAGAAYRITDARGASQTLLPLPAWRDIPVVVGARMSLSFPLLIAAVPLYTISVAGQREASAGKTLRADHIQRHVFSDGGIASNFPIHFFDRWLPTHPTFGINLVQLPADEADNEQFLQTLLADDVAEAAAEPAQPGVIVKQAHLGRADFRAAAPVSPPQMRAAAPFSNPQGEVYLPPAGPGEDYIEWHAIGSLPAFFWSIFGTAQNYRDTAQARLPGYNERVVRVRLRPEEGGLNLRMPSRIVAEIMRKGRLAGRALLPQEPEAAGRRRGGFTFDDHRWVRLVTLLSEIDQQLNDMRSAYDDVQADYATFLRNALTNDNLPVCPPYYTGSAEERALFARRIEALIALYTLWSDLDEETTARLNTILLRMNKRTLQDLARLLDQPDDQEALSGLHRWLAAMHAEKVRLAKAAERESSPVEDMIDLRVMPTI